MDKAIPNDLEVVIEILSRGYRNAEELEHLTSYLMIFSDYRKYVSNITRTAKLNLARVMYVEFCAKDSFIFHKGDASDKFYIVLFGAVDAYNQEKDGSLTYVGTLHQGKQIGERGLVRSQPRSLTMIANEDTYLLTLNAEDFLAYLSSDVFKLMERKLHFIEKYFPNVRKYTYVQKERIAYSMSLEDYKRGHHVMIKGRSNENLYFISEGELALSLEFDDKVTANVVKLGPGNCFGEETVLLGRRNFYNVVVISERALLYVMRRSDVYNVMPDEVLDTWKINFELKEKGRRMLIDSTRVRLKNYSPEAKSTTENKYFPQASSYAKRRLNEFTTRLKANSAQISHNSNVSRNKTPEPRVKSYKLLLEGVKDSAPKEEARSLSTTKNRSASPLATLTGSLLPRPLMSKSAKSTYFISTRARNRIRRISPIN